MTPEEQIKRIRKIVTEWNFGPVNSRWAMEAIFAIVGDDIQNECVPSGSKLVQNGTQKEHDG
jgi:hypothetical protein